MSVQQSLEQALSETDRKAAERGCTDRKLFPAVARARSAASLSVVAVTAREVPNALGWTPTGWCGFLLPKADARRISLFRQPRSIIRFRDIGRITVN